MKIIKLFLSFVFFAFCFNTSFADNIKAQATAEFTEKLTEYVTNLIPGEGTTEVSIDMQESSEPVYSILAVRPLKELDKSNLFTQFSFQNTDVAGDERYIFNLGLGKRILNQDETMMFGFNSFVDYDIFHRHERISYGLEAKAKMLEFNLNHYFATSTVHTIGANAEQSLGGVDYKLISQVPYAPWAKISYRGYKLDNDNAPSDARGDAYSVRMYLTPTMLLEMGIDDSNIDEETFGTISFVYPPNENSSGVGSMLDGFSSDAFEKVDMKKMMLSKVERRNKLFVEIQGDVIITKK